VICFAVKHVEPKPLTSIELLAIRSECSTIVHLDAISLLRFPITLYGVGNVNLEILGSNEANGY
jgi:hypothetical protein